MSDTSNGPGWWMASDGKWYPPHLHPSAQPATQFPPAQPATQFSPAQPATQFSPAQPLQPADPYGTGSTVLPPASKRARRPLLVGMTIALVLAVAAGVLVGVLGSGSNSNADAAIVKAVNSAIADKSAHVAVTSTIEAAGRSITESGSGSVDFTTNALDVTITGSADGQQISVEAIYLAGTIYERLPQISEIAPGKNWISLDLSSLTQQAQQGGTGGLSGNPLATLHALALQGNTVSPLGASTIDGQSVQGYSVTLNPSVLQGEIGSANLPDWMKQVVSQIKVNGGSEEVYLANDGSLVRESITVGEKLGSAGVVNVDASYDFSDYGTPVVIAAPPSDQVLSISQFLQLAGGSTSA